MPEMPPGKGAKIKVLVTKSDGSQQHYWMSLDNFRKMREKGINVKKVDSGSPAIPGPGQFSRGFEEEFINNFVQYGGAGLQFGDDIIKAELITEVKITKNDKLIRTLPLKIKRHKIARLVLENIQVGK